MELLGKNVSNFKKTKENFSDRLAYEILLQMLNAIEGLHQKGFLHRDIKPTNFVVGNDTVDEKSPRVYVVDFGLSKLHLDKKGRVLQPRKETDFRGTLTYASLNAHYKKELSRRDDLFSFFFVILELLNEAIPWRYLKDDREQIAKKKEICLRDPKNFLFVTSLKNKTQVFDILEYLKSLNYEDKPNYRYIRNKIEEMYMEELEKENLIMNKKSIGFINSTKSLNTSISSISNYSNQAEVASSLKLKSPISDYLNYFCPRVDKDKLNKTRNTNNIQSKSLEQETNLIKDKNFKDVKDLLIPNFTTNFNSHCQPNENEKQKDIKDILVLPLLNKENDLCQKKRKRDDCEFSLSDTDKYNNLIKTVPTSQLDEVDQIYQFDSQKIQQPDQDYKDKSTTNFKSSKNKNNFPIGKEYFNKNFIHNFCEEVNLLLQRKIPISENRKNFNINTLQKNYENENKVDTANKNHEKVNKLENLFLPFKTESSFLNSDRNLLDFFKKNLETISISTNNSQPVASKKLYQIKKC